MSPAFSLVEVDSLEALIIIDNELDVMSPISPDAAAAGVTLSGQMLDLALKSPNHIHEHERGGAAKELRMESICCAAHGFSVLIV
jgi:7,8-dihydropterin-6-yl-methyl-4-(beta-D-ribofuranosyl)aminobenzene 5'-phosphate synthase